MSGSYKMLNSFCLCVAFLFIIVDASSSDTALRFEPQVAMACGSRNSYHAQYMNDAGKWVTDTSSKITCLKDKIKILRYCKEVYPDRDITNIVEASHYYKVPDFCRVGHSKCKTTIWVKPYRCLEGTFQSDALLVPEGCLFDHIHNQSRCWEFDQWNTTADQACQAKHLSLKAFAMLLPCGIDVFSGVEFVCCPKNYKNHGKVRTPMDVEEPLALPKVDRRAESLTSTSAVPTLTPAEVATRDEYFSRFDPHEEHDAFRRAEQRLEDRHRDKVSKIMKEWSDLEERYSDLRQKDPRGAEEFKHRVTQRLQQTVQALEAENEAEKHQLTALHQQRIVAHINEMKREAMTCYTRALTSPPMSTHKIQKCLQKLLRALNKDRHHTVAHFKHLLASDEEVADKERDSTLQHLADLDKLVNQSLSMLARHPEIYAKIGRLMEKYAASLRSKEVTPPELTPPPPTPKEEKTIPEDEDDEDYDDDEDDDDDESDEDDDDDDESDEDDDDDDDDDSDELDEESNERIDDDASEQHRMSVNQNDVKPLPQETENEIVPVSSQLPIDEVPTAHKLEEPKVAHARHNVLSHESKFSLSEELHQEPRGVYFTLAFAGIALMGAMIVGIVILRRRSGKDPHNQGFIEVDQAVTPEERHVTNMQVNGYENPTYKYFEK